MVPVALTTEDLREHFYATSPKGFILVAFVMTYLGVSRQTIWYRARLGDLASCHVTHGMDSGLYVPIPDVHDLPQLYQLPAMVGPRPYQQLHDCRPTTTLSRSAKIRAQALASYRKTRKSGMYNFPAF